MPSGAHVLLQALNDSGVSVCFANPGTTELDFVRALEAQPGWRCVLGLHENVCTGAADGYGRMASRPAATVLHLGPGLANGAANLHNARRARTPIVNLVGDHMSWHLAVDAPLASDIESLARPVSGWVHRIQGPADLAPAGRAAVAQALQGQGATLIVPADFQAAECTDSDGQTASSFAGNAANPAAGTDTLAAGAAAAGATAAAPVRQDDLDALATRLAATRRPLFLLGGGGERSALSRRGQLAAARLVARLDGSAYAETFPARAERGGGLPDFDRLPYFPEPARAVLDAAGAVVLVGALEPVTYFGYEGHPSRLVPAERLLPLCSPGEDAVALLEALADRLQAPPEAPVPPRVPVPDLPEAAPLTPALIGAVLTRGLPEGAIVSVEGGTCGYPFYAASARAAAHTALTNTGGAIGQGLPVALGAAVACPGRPVVALVSDGSTQYTVQALWTIAHESLPVLVLVAANHQYAILRNELKRGGAALGPQALALTALDAPRIDWVRLAESYGVPARRAATVAELGAALRDGFAGGGPLLVEMAL